MRQTFPRRKGSSDPPKRHKGGASSEVGAEKIIHYAYSTAGSPSTENTKTTVPPKRLHKTGDAPSQE